MADSLHLCIQPRGEILKSQKTTLRTYCGRIDRKLDGKKVLLKGWVKEVRDLKKLAFLILRDGTGDVQVVAKPDMPFFTEMTGISRESVVEVSGAVKFSEKTNRGFEILPDSFNILNLSEKPLPLDPDEKKPANLDTRIDNRFIDLRKPSVSKIFKLKSILLKACRDFFDKNGFTEINTPKIVEGGAEGGANLFSIDYFGRKALLAQSPQLYKQMMVGTGLDRVWETAPAFRAEKSNTTRHLSEFLSVDAEIAFINDENDVMDWMEKLAKHLLKAAAKAGVEVPKAKKFPRIDVEEALKMIGEQPAGDLNTEQEKKLGEVMKAKGHPFYFLVNYHSSDKPFYIMEQKDPKFCKAFDLEFNGTEIVSGGQREHRHSELLKRMGNLGVDPECMKSYLESFRYGMPPHGGFALGIERFVELLLNLDNVREAVLLPRDTVRLLP